MGHLHLNGQNVITGASVASEKARKTRAPHRVERPLPSPSSSNVSSALPDLIPNIAFLYRSASRSKQSSPLELQAPWDNFHIPFTAPFTVPEIRLEHVATPPNCRISVSH